MTEAEVKQWVAQQAHSQSEKAFQGLERALRQSLIDEGVLPPSALWEDQADDPSQTIQLEIKEEFERSFTEASLGIALNVGKRGTIIVKRCVPGSPSASRRIPPGVVLTHVGETPLGYPSLKEVQTLLQSAERPVKLRFRQTEASLAVAHQSVRAVAHERAEHERKQAEAKARFAEEGYSPYIGSTKSLTGHALGAAGVFEAIFSLLMVNKGFLAESANLNNVVEEAEGLKMLTSRFDGDVKRVMSNSFGFGGTNCCLVFDKYEPA